MSINPEELDLVGTPSISVIIPSTKKQIITAINSDVKEIIVVRGGGIGSARNAGVNISHGSRIAMFDDDLILHPNIWNFIQSIKPGEFAMANVGEHVSTRVFIINHEDFMRIGGFDPNIQFIFEDGDFYIRALQKGLHFRLVPSTLYSHIAHFPRYYNRGLLVRMSWEQSHFLVKYKRHVYRNPFNIFFELRDWKLYPFHSLTKVVGILYWILKGA